MTYLTSHELCREESKMADKRTRRKRQRQSEQSTAQSPSYTLQEIHYEQTTDRRMDGEQMAQALSANTNLPTEAEVTLTERHALSKVCGFK